VGDRRWVHRKVTVELCRLQCWAALCAVGFAPAATMAAVRDRRACRSRFSGADRVPGAGCGPWF